MSSAHIICVGDELLSGAVADVHGSYLSRFLAERSVPVSQIALVGDKREQILAALAASTARASLVIVTGGLGPTSDDRTREALALLVGQDLVFDEVLWQQIQRAVGRALEGSNRQQAQRPPLFEPLDNRRGTAPGLIGEVGGCRVVALPGPPHELRGMIENHGERIVDSLGTAKPLCTAVSCFGIPESRLEDGLRQLAEGAERAGGGADGIEWHTRAEHLRILLRLTGGTEEAHARIIEGLRNRFGATRVAAGERTLAQVVVAELAQAGWLLAAAESCTGGMLGAALTDVPGSSEVFWGSLVTYANAAKKTVLGVSDEIVDRHGAVSKQAVLSMAKAVREKSGVEIAVAVSGIAGPGGGSDEKPVGTVWIALETAKGANAAEFRFSGDRARVRGWALTEALLMIREAVTFA